MYVWISLILLETIESIGTKFCTHLFIEILVGSIYNFVFQSLSITIGWPTHIFHFGSRKSKFRTRNCFVYII